MASIEEGGDGGHKKGPGVKKAKKLSTRVDMHFGKGHEEQVHGIQHEFYAHEYDDRIAAGKYPHYANAEQGNRQDDIIKYRHIVHLEGG